MAETEDKVFTDEEEGELRNRLTLPVVANPFSYHDNFGVLEFLKCSIGAVVVIVRFTLAFTILIFMWIIGRFTISCGFDEEKPMGPVRRICLKPARLLQRAFLFIFGFYWIDVKGKRDRSAPVCVVAPHSTFVDTWVVASQIGTFSGLGKIEARKTPIFGTFFRASQIVAVDRSRPDGRREALNEFVRRVKEEPKFQFVVFPEGTCTNRKSLIQFKRGSFVPGAPVQPIVLRWPFQHFDLTWTSSSNRNRLILRMLTQVYNRAQLEYLPVYHPNEEEKADADLFAENVRKVVAEALNVPMSEHSYDDSFLSMAAKKEGFNPDHILTFEFKSLKEQSNINLKTAKRWLKVFGKSSRAKKTGKLRLTDFASVLGVPLTGQVISFFGLLDPTNSETVDFRSFLIGVGFVRDKLSPAIKEKAVTLFKSLEGASKGVVAVDVLCDAVGPVFPTADVDKVKEQLTKLDKGMGVAQADVEEVIASNLCTPQMLFGSARDHDEVAIPIYTGKDAEKRLRQISL